nr:hypothetical protein [Tanacetum cinerariifolium]
MPRTQYSAATQFGGVTDWYQEPRGGPDEDPADYPADGGDNDDNESSDDNEDDDDETMTNVNQGMSVEEIERVVAHQVANAIEEDPAYYPADRGKDDDDDESSNDDDNVEKDEEDKEEEEHLALADPFDVSTDNLVPSSKEYRGI